MSNFLEDTLDTALEDRLETTLHLGASVTALLCLSFPGQGKQSDD